MSKSFAKLQFAVFPVSIRRAGWDETKEGCRVPTFGSKLARWAPYVTEIRRRISRRVERMLRTASVAAVTVLAPSNSWTRARRRRPRRRPPAQPIEALPHAVRMPEALRQRAPANVLDGEEMQRLEEAAIVLGLPPTARQAGAKHRKRVRPIVLIHTCRHWLRPLIRSE
jgi:hypothetical protein